jgi:hypothetical protein
VDDIPGCPVDGAGGAGSCDLALEPEIYMYNMLLKMP